METNLLDRMLSAYQDGRTPVTVILQNKALVSGRIKAFDSYVIVMEGHKQEIVYRHAVSSLALHAQEEQKRQPVVSRPAPSKASPPVAARIASQKSSHKFKLAQPQALSASTSEPGLNNGMKDGLLKWMQEQRTAK